MTREEVTFLHLSIGYSTMMLFGSLMAGISALSDSAFITLACLALGVFTVSYATALLDDGFNRRVWAHVYDYEHDPLIEQKKRVVGEEA